MAQNENMNKDQLPPISREDQAFVEQIVDQIFEANLDKRLPLIEKFINTLKPQKVGSAFETLQITLKSLWEFFAAIRYVRSEGDFLEASKLFRSAAEGFGQVGKRELRDLSIGFVVYLEAVTELQKMNIGQAMELFKMIKEYLKNAGKYGRIFEQFVDEIEPDAIFVGAVNALMQLDFANAKALIEKASQAAEKVAHNYYREGEPLYNTFQGFAHFYKTYYTFVKALSDFNQFQYDKLTNKQDLLNEAILAHKLLDKGDTENVTFRNVNYMLKGIIQLLESISDLSRLMRTIFNSTFKPDLKTLMLLKQNIDSASNMIAKAGPQAVPLIRLCNQISNQVNNLERLAKPTKKDFGAFSGVVASALFLPLFLVVSWANSTFEIGLDGKTLIVYCLVLALIGGFGFGALKFKSMIFPGRT